MNARGMLFSRVFVFGCTLAVMAFAAQRAHAGLKPEAPPHSHGGSHSVGTLHPVAPGGGSATSSSTSTAATHYTPPVSTSTPVVQRAAVAAAIVRSTPRPAVTQPQRHVAPPQPRPRHRASAQFSGWPVGLRDAAGLNELRSVASSGGSSLLFVAGFALLLLVIAEASFLGLMGSRPGAAGERAPAKRRPADEPYAIRPVQLRR
ncbi:MAG TPA: hypothetical protein VI142_05970 [Gaiellaceae bacterium]